MKRRGQQGILALVSILFAIGITSAATEMLSGAAVQADPESVKTIIAAFDRAEEALHTENLPAMMAVYSKGYQNRGLRKEETSRIWQDLFTRYDRLSSRHVFSKIVVDREKKTAHVTCTGALFGTSVFNKERPEPVRIDFWFEAVHHLVFEEGAWKIVGHDPGAGEEGPLGSALHLLF
ncbi:MAG: hypothetical protein EPO39_02815 [Candidatus Manganitrophaceae bacterium]|nr:MAG: hypothetical protein EPO39_02815 [Candidatus Manganitrophaceae bacterium]